MDPVWIENGRRTPFAHKFVLAVQAELRMQPQDQDSRKALENAIAVVRKRDLTTYKRWGEPTLRRRYYEVAPLPPPLSVEKDRWMSLLRKWGLSSEEAGALAARALAMATDSPKASYVGQLFDYIDSRRAFSRQRKANRVRRAVNQMEADPLRWPPLKAGSDRTGKMILAALNKGLSSIAEIVAATNLNPITVQNYLHNMHDNGEIRRVRFGRYAPLAEGLACYVQPSKAILNVLERGSATPAQIRARTGLSEAQVAGSLHWLWRHKKIAHAGYGKWALPGAATPHVYAKDAIPRVRSPAQRQWQNSRSLPARTAVSYGPRFEV